MRHLRSLAIAAVVLMISAAVVFAGGGPAWKATTPPEAEASAAPSVAPSESPAASPAEASPSPEVAAGTTVVEEESNHGAVVSDAARNGPGDGVDASQYRNHGEYVSSVARQNHGQSKKSDAGATSKAKGGQPVDDEEDDADD